jgi:hypothetical protein
VGNEWVRVIEDITVIRMVNAQANLWRFREFTRYKIVICTCNWSDISCEMREMEVICIIYCI